MLNKISRIACIIVSFFYALEGITQTITINYLTSSLSTSACNVFNPSVGVSGVTHSSLAGGVSFDATNGIKVSTVPSGSSAGGTAFIIQNNFIPGSNYNISITATGDNALYLKTSVVPNLNQFTTSSTTSCTPDAYVAGYSTVGYGQLSTTTSTSSTTYNVP